MSDANEAKLDKKRDFAARIVRASGTVISNPKEALKVLADVVADKIEGNAEATLMAGIDYLNKKGEISDDFIENRENRHLLIQIRRDINVYKKDESKLFRKIHLFLGIVSGQIEASNVELRRIWTLVDNLTEEEVVLLASCYRLHKKAMSEGRAEYEPDARAWLKMMAKESGLNHIEFTEEAETNLIRHWLLEKRTIHDQVKVTTNYRLTDLGILVSKLLEKGAEATQTQAAQ